MRGRPIGQRIDTAVARHVDTQLPDSSTLPRYLAPLPEWLENVALRLVWLLVAINLVGTAVGFWYYLPQLRATPLIMWPIVPVSPLATLYMAISLTAWRLGRTGRVWQLIHLLAFVGCLKYGLWSVFVQLYVEGPGYVHPLLWQFLIWSHAGMVIQAFLIHRYAEFPAWAIAIATGWYASNDLFDFFLTVQGGPHHTWLNRFWTGVGFDRTIAVYDHMAMAAVIATIIATAIAMATHLAMNHYGTGYQYRTE